MSKFPLDPELGAFALFSKEVRYKFEDNKKTDKVEGINVKGVPLGALADILRNHDRPIKIKLPNEEFKFKRFEEVQMINFTLTPYTKPGKRFVQFSFSADGFRPIDSDGVSSEGDVE